MPSTANPPLAIPPLAYEGKHHVSGQGTEPAWARHDRRVHPACGPGSIWPSQAGTGISKDVWMLGIGLGLTVGGLADLGASQK
jgi:hypothetical protein